MNKVLLVAFQGEPMCFAHVLLNALDMHEKGFKVKVVIEGAATSLIGSLNDPATPFSDLYVKVRNMGLIDCVCKACAAKMRNLEHAQAQGLVISDNMHGHPSLAKFIEMGYQIITF
ncbi:MAG: hypothetical protein JXM68_02405 [Sedimentisphaerales bacterium]|nr:hypothetical protein [Sedimentisphaerales bacterium]